MRSHLRRTAYLKQGKNTATKQTPFQNVLVQYTGGIHIAPPFTQAQPARPSLPAPQPGLGTSPYRFVDMLFDDMFQAAEFMLVDRSDAVRHSDREKDKVHTRLGPLRDAVRGLLERCSFLLRKPWPLMFVSLFFDAAEIRGIMARGDVEFDIPEPTRRDPGWEAHARDVFLWTYWSEERWERRAVDEIDRTFEAARVYIDGGAGWAGEKEREQDEIDKREAGEPAPVEVGAQEVQARQDTEKRRPTANDDKAVVEGSGSEQAICARPRKRKGKARQKSMSKKTKRAQPGNDSDPDR